jgi:hypothetical protein
MKSKLADFIPAEYPGVYYDPKGTAKLFSYSDSDAAENELLEILQKTEDKSTFSGELEKSIHNWTTRYHFAGARANIIRSLDFLPENSKVLEIGAGCGAVTRFLGERFNTVDAIEGSYRRASIAAERCKDLENVKIFNAPLQEIVFDKEYDLVILIGVLEWAPLFYNDNITQEDACSRMLDHAFTALKSDGTIVIAIENKLGLKYWSGCREDHTGKFFDNIHGYPDTKTAKTFSRKELSCLLNKSDLKYHRFYYPFPDYKLAHTILSDVSEPDSYYLHNWCIEPFNDYSAGREFYFNEGLAARSLAKGSLFYDFSNSFLITASAVNNAQESIAEPIWAARKYSNTTRASQFRTLTELKKRDSTGNATVTKTVLFPDDNKHKGDFIFTPSDSEWIPGDLLQFKMIEALYQKEPDTAFLDALKLYHDTLIEQFSIDSVTADGYPLLKDNAVDFLPINIIYRDKEMKSFDLEWSSSVSLTADYMLFRTLFHFIMQQGVFVFQKLTVVNNNIDLWMIKIIRQFYPGYNAAKHQINRELEEVFQSFVSGNEARLPTAATLFENSKSSYDKLMDSWSWKITAPFRWVRNILLKSPLTLPLRIIWKKIRK